MNNSNFPITCWCGVPGSLVRKPDGTLAKEHFDRMKEVGLTYIPVEYDTETNKEVLRYLEEIGLMATVNDSRVSMAINSTENRESLIKSVALDYKDFPALFDYYVVDEPNARLFEALSEINKYFKKYDSKHSAIINLFPNYANEEQLGNPTYYEHVDKYISLVKPDIISYDHYHFLKGAPKENVTFKDDRERLIYEDAFKGSGSAYECVDRPGFFNNIAEVQEISAKYDTPFMIIILVVEHGPYRNLTEAEIGWEVWQSLAYGSKRISYFTYWTPGVDESAGDSFWHWKNGMVTKKGELNPHYFMVQSINKKLAKVGKEILNKQVMKTAMIGNLPNEKVTVFDSPFMKLQAVTGGDFTIGYFEDDYVLIANRDYTNSATCEIKTAGEAEIYDYEQDSWSKLTGIISINVPAGDGVLVKIK